MPALENEDSVEPVAALPAFPLCMVFDTCVGFCVGPKSLIEIALAVVGAVWDQTVASIQAWLEFWLELQLSKKTKYLI